ncbi:hypothetical protein WDW37_05575 [Bdellovibrionota bacterium FG-1]
MNYDNDLVEVNFTLNGRTISYVILPEREILKTPFRREPVAIAIKNALDDSFIEPKDSAKEEGDIDVYGVIIGVNGQKIDITFTLHFDLVHGVFNVKEIRMV